MLREKQVRKRLYYRYNVYLTISVFGREHLPSFISSHPFLESVVLQNVVDLKERLVGLQSFFHRLAIVLLSRPFLLPIVHALLLVSDHAS